MCGWYNLCWALGLFLFRFWLGCIFCCGCDFGSCFLHCFFSSPSVIESPLSLPLFNMVVVSITSGCSTGGCCFFFFFLRFYMAFVAVGVSLVGVVVYYNTN